MSEGLKMTTRLSVYKPSFGRKERYRIIYGGAGSGKSVFVAQEYLLEAAEKGRVVMAVRKVKNSCRMSTFKLFQDILRDMGRLPTVRINQTMMKIEFKSGGLIFNEGLDDVEKLKSVAGVDLVWVEEASELTEDDLQQVDLRVRGMGRKQITYTFNPVNQARRIFKRLKVPVNQLPQYTRSCGAYGKNVWIQHTTKLDNDFVGEDYDIAMSMLSKAFDKVYREGILSDEDEFNQTISHESVDKALKIDPMYHDGTMRMGVDVARGADESAIALCRGWHLDKLIPIQTRDTMKVAKAAFELATEHGVIAANIGVDSIGVGGGVADRLREYGLKITEIISGSRPVNAPYLLDTNVEFADLRSQMWWFTRELLASGQATISDKIDEGDLDMLREDLTAPRWMIQNEDKIKVEPKYVRGGRKVAAIGGFSWGVRERIGRSTDRGDAFIYALSVDLVNQPHWLAVNPNKSRHRISDHERLMQMHRANAA